MKILMILIYSTLSGVTIDKVPMDSMKECYSTAAKIYHDYAENAPHIVIPLQGILCTRDEDE
jgi:hypothetical protein